LGLAPCLIGKRQGLTPSFLTPSFATASLMTTNMFQERFHDVLPKDINLEKSKIRIPR
jgi:hypothetical protein